jgi:hypothetical protein
MKYQMNKDAYEETIAGYAYGNQGKDMKPSNMRFSTDYIGEKQDPKEIKRIARNQPQFDKKPSKKLPLEREFLTGDPEIDNAEYRWVSRIEVTDGKVVISWVPQRIQ